MTPRSKTGMFPGMTVIAMLSTVAESLKTNTLGSPSCQIETTRPSYNVYAKNASHPSRAPQI